MAGGAAEQLALGGSLQLWDCLLQPWLHKLRRELPTLAIIAESHTTEGALRAESWTVCLMWRSCSRPPVFEALQVEAVSDNQSSVSEP